MTQGPFDFWEKNGRLDFQRGDVRVYNVGGEDYLFVDQTLYASTIERPWYISNLMPLARGKVLEIGLGLGCASKVMLACGAVKHILTVESNEDVIAAFGRLLPRHHLLHADVYEWVKGVPKDFPFYDFIFVDHYTLDDDEVVDELQELARELSPLLKPGGQMVFWIDENAPDEDQEKIRALWLTNN